MIRKSIAAFCAAALTAGPALANESALHVMRIDRAAAHPPASTMLYYAGPVIANMKAVAVIWGKGVNKTTVGKVPGFLKAIVNSTYVDLLAQYDTNRKGVNGMQGTNQLIKRGTYLGEVTITPKNTARRLTDAQVQTELEGQIAAGKLPANDTNTLYLIYFPANITITAFGLTSCVQFGAYHSATQNQISASNVFYTVEPDCGGGFTEQTVASSHEYGEATTDAIPTPGSNPAFPQAWNTSNGSEIGDLCEGNNATLTAGKTSYTVQELFDNAHNRCAVGNYTSP